MKKMKSFCYSKTAGGQASWGFEPGASLWSMENLLESKSLLSEKDETGEKREEIS